MSEADGLAALFLSSFLAATLLPGGSEAVLYVVLATGTAAPALALTVATVGNTLGALVSYALGRLLPHSIDSRALQWMRRYGAPALLLAWAPVVGDALCVAAGWMRVNLWWATVCIAIGKFARYWAIAELAL